MLSHLLLKLPLIHKELFTQALISFGLLVLGSLLSLVIWVLLVSQLIFLAEGKKSLKHYFIWTIIVPFLNLLWVPWAIISTNYLVKKTQDNYFKVNAINSAMGIQILSIPLLILYLFWGVIAFIMRGSLFNLSNYPDSMMYVSVVLSCILIVFGFYLVYLSLFVGKMRKFVHRSNSSRDK